MTVLQEILEWSQDRPTWQRDALRRLVLQGELTDEDILALAGICKSAHGLAEPTMRTAPPRSATVCETWVVIDMSNEWKRRMFPLRDFPRMDLRSSTAIAAHWSDRKFWMENPSRDGHWLDLVVLADSVRSLFAQTGAYPLNIGKNEGFAATAANKRVQNDRLEE